MSVDELTAENIRVEYTRRDGGTMLAVEDVSLRIAKGKFLSIVGPSGCGKTTLLKCVSGLVNPVSGSLHLRARESSGTSLDRALVFQDASLFPWYTVQRNVAYGLECQGVRRREAIEQVQPLIELVGLTGFESYYPHEISGGMQQRTNLARALAVSPQLLLMDEPFAALDAQTREMMQEELLEVWSKTGQTVLFITHQIGEAIYLSDRVVVLSARPGRVIADIDIELARPRALSVKREQRFLDYEERIWKLIEVEARSGLPRREAKDGQTTAQDGKWVRG